MLRFFVLLFFLIFYQSLEAKNGEHIMIHISTHHKTISLNSHTLDSFELNSIYSLFGKPNRIKTHSYSSYIEEFPYEKGGQKTLIPIQITNYYYIYDQMGLMFFTRNGKWNDKNPNRLHIYFQNKRAFTNHKAEPFSPKNFFSGDLKINSTLLKSNIKLVPDSVHYRTASFDLFEMKFGPTSITTLIDSLYSINASPYIQIFLNNKKDQFVSYVELVHVKRD